MLINALVGENIHTIVRCECYFLVYYLEIYSHHLATHRNKGVQEIRHQTPIYSLTVGY
jgi:hypothetical protein